MGESLHVDPTRLRAMAPGLEKVAGEVSHAVQKLQATMVEEGACWGRDDTGKLFEETYLPDLQRGVESLEAVAEGLRRIGSAVTHAAKAFDSGDHIGASQLRHAGADHDTVSEAAGLGPSLPQNLAEGHPAGIGPGEVAEPPLFTGPVGSGQVPGELTGLGASAGPDTPVSNRGARETTPEIPARRQSEESIDPGRREDIDASGRPSGSPDLAPSSPASDDRDLASSTAFGNRGLASSASGSPNGVPLTARTGEVRAPIDRPSAGTPWSPRPPRTPWSSGSDAVRMSGEGAPPRVSAPQRSDRLPATGRPSAVPRRRTAPDRSVSAAPPPPRDAITDAVAMRIAREMAARHNLVILGFETAGASEDTMREIAAGVDDMLAKYPVALHGIALTDLHTGTLPGGYGADGGGSSAPWIVVDRSRVADPALPGRTVATAGRAVGGADSGPGWSDRPIYAAVVGEFGRVLDTVGDFRARRQTQRTLITEYFRISGTRRGDRLAHIVGRYRYWRDHWAARGVPGRFDPATALTQAFAEVELHGSDAGPQAKALHRLLTGLAQQSIDTRADH